jgi:hypothetical protein
MDNQAFVNALMPHALAVSRATGIDPRIVIAQSAIETGWGRSAPGNNYFGIKSHGAPGGQTLATTEVVNGQPVRMNDSFRGYADLGASAQDYAHFLKSNARYAPVLQAQGLEAQAAALGKSGYATDPDYGAKVYNVARGLPTPGRLRARRSLGVRAEPARHRRQAPGGRVYGACHRRPRCSRSRVTTAWPRRSRCSPRPAAHRSQEVERPTPQLPMSTFEIPQSQQAAAPMQAPPPRPFAPPPTAQTMQAPQFGIAALLGNATQIPGRPVGRLT